jgi:hypothetical protein
MRFEKGLYKPFAANNTDIKGGWADFAGKEVPDGEVLVRPARATPYRMADFEAFEVNGKLTYVGIFKPGADAPMALFESDWNKFLAGWKAIEASGYRMKDFECIKKISIKCTPASSRQVPMPRWRCSRAVGRLFSKGGKRSKARTTE